MARKWVAPDAWPSTLAGVLAPRRYICGGPAVSTALPETFVASLNLLIMLIHTDSNAGLHWYLWYLCSIQQDRTIHVGIAPLKTATKNQREDGLLLLCMDHACHVFHLTAMARVDKVSVLR